MIDPDRFLHSLINKQIDVPFARRDYRLSVSHALFSSNSLDSGTASLLRLIERSVDLVGVSTVMDLGCGTGALGIPIAGAASADLVAVDRDALAVWFAARNAEDAGVAACDARCDIAGGRVAAGSCSLALSNLPGKAGRPVLKQLVGNLSAAVGSVGICGAVIVRPLFEMLESHLFQIGASISQQKVTANHVAVIWNHGGVENSQSSRGDQSDVAPYIRDRQTFDGPKMPYVCSTAYGLPDFDSLSFRITLAFQILSGLQLGGRVVVYGAGQGHLLLGCLQCGARDPTIADHDALALAVSAENVGVTAPTMLVPTLSSAAAQIAPQSVDWLIIDDDPFPDSLWLEEIHDSARHVLALGGKLLVISRSTPSARLEQELGKEFRRIDARKQKGYRAALWKLIDIANRS